MDVGGACGGGVGGRVPSCETTLVKVPTSVSRTRPIPHEGRADRSASWESDSFPRDQAKQIVCALARRRGFLSPSAGDSRGRTLAPAPHPTAFAFAFAFACGVLERAWNRPSIFSVHRWWIHRWQRRRRFRTSGTDAAFSPSLPFTFCRVERTSASPRGNMRRSRTSSRGRSLRNVPNGLEGRMLERNEPRTRFVVRQSSRSFRNACFVSRGRNVWTSSGIYGMVFLLTISCPNPCPALGTESQARSEIAVLHRLDPRVPASRFAEDVLKDLETLNTAFRSKWQQSVPPKLSSTLDFPSGEADGSTGDSTEVEENRSLLQDLWDVVDRNYYAVGNASPLDHQLWKETLETNLRSVDLRDRASTFRAAEKMLKSVSSGDRYTRFLMPAEFDRLKRYDASGVGVNLCSDEEYLRRAGRGDAPTVDVDATADSVDGEKRGQSVHAPRVLGLVPGSAADKAGLKQGDQVLEINGFPIDGDVSPWEATEKFQNTATGQAYATVTILKGHGGDLATLQIKLPDRQVKREYTTTSSFLLSSSPWGNRVGVIRLSEMGATTPKEVKDRVQSLLQEGIDGLLIDLRGNRGGLVPSAIEVARMFLHNDQRAVIAAGGIADPLAAQEVLQGIEQVPYNLPVVLQVDGSTASAAEILVGALRDNCRAIVVGTHNTFGKGIVQSVYALPQGAGLVLTVGAYQTPAMRPIHLVGMPPDFRDVPTVAEAQEVLDRCSRESFEK